MEFNVMNYGAKGDGVTDDRAAIQAAVNAARDAGGGVVVIPEGTYIVTGQSSPSLGCIMLYSGVTVVGAGIGLTNIKLQDGWNGAITGIFRDPYGVGSHDITIRDLTIDGNRAHTTGKIDGWFNGGAPGSPVQDKNITIDQVEVKDCGGYGFDPHEQTVNLTITNSISHGNGLDGFTLDYQIGSVIENNLAYGNDRHGFNIVTSAHDIQLTDNISHDNGGAGIMIQRGSTDIAVPDNINIDGGSLYNNALDGVQINKANHVTIDAVDIYKNGQRGIRVMGSVGSVIKNSTIHDNSQSKDGGYQEISLESYNDTAGASGHWYYTTGTQILNNKIYDTTLIRSNYGIRELNDGTDYTVISGNTITGTKHNTPQLFGPHTTTPIPLMTYAHGTDFADTVQGIDEGASTLAGYLGNDTLSGASKNDVLVGGQGNDVLSGGGGNDLFLIDSGSDSITVGTGINTIKFNGAFAPELGISSATVTDFHAGPGGDKLDVAELLTVAGYTGSNAVADGYITFTQSGADTHVMFDADGAAGAGAPVLLATLNNTLVANITAANLVTTAQTILYAPTTGQSNAANLSKPSPDGGSGVAHITDGLTARAGFGQVVTLVKDGAVYIDLAVGGSTVNGDNPNVTDPNRVWWYPSSGTAGPALLNAVKLMTEQLATLRAQGNVKPIVIWGQGEAETAGIGSIADPVARAAAVQNYINETRAVFDYLKAHVGSDLQFYMMETGRFNVTGGQNYGLTADKISKYVAGFDAVHGAQESMALQYSDVHLAVNYTDLPMYADVTLAQDPNALATDYLHLSGASREIVGDRLADFISLDLGNIHVVSNPGPYPLDVLSDLTIRDGSGLTVDGTAQNDIIAGTNSNDLLRGLGGNDALVGGAGNDTFEGGGGTDTIFGGTGADTFLFSLATAPGAVDTLKDFSVAQGDRIDISNLILSYHALTDNVNDYVRITTDGLGNSILSIDADGTGTTYGFTQIALLSGVTSLASVSSLVASGNLLVNTTNHAPTPQADSFAGTEDTNVTGNVFADNGSGADSDPDGDALIAAAGTFTTAHNGTVVLSSDGSFVYTPAANYNGADSFTYSVIDVQNVATQATVTFTLAAVNDAPVARDDFFLAAGGFPVFGNVLADNGSGADSDVESDPLTVTAGTLTTSHGATVSLMADGTFTLTPALGYLGSDTFSYTVSDGQGGSGSASVWIFVNMASVAQDDDFTANWGQNITGNVMADNGHGADSNPDGDTLTVSAMSSTSANGFSFSLAADGTLLYAPPAWFVGSDSLQYRLSDGHGGLSQATVNLTVNAPAGSVVGTMLQESLTGTEASEYIFGDGGADTLQGLGGDDILIGGPSGQSMAGGTGNDTYYVDSVNDTLIEAAGEGTDTVTTAISYTLADNVENLILTGSASVNATGNAGDNVLTGNSGANILTGGTGNDTYSFTTGHGADTIVEAGGTDTILFDATVTAASVSYVRTGNDLLITHGVAGDSITVSGFFTATANQIDSVTFANGTVHDLTFINAAAHILGGTGGADTITSYDNGNTTLTGLAGNDSLTGLGGNDNLTGGTGNDSLAGGTGNDTYLYGAGDGQDTVVEAGGIDVLLLGAGITAASVTYAHTGNDLIITDGIAGDSITVSGFFSSTANLIESVQFAAGGVTDAASIIRQVHTKTGTAGADNMAGRNDANYPADYLYGLTGNDTLNGGAGDDLVDGGTGADNMTGGTGNDTYTYDSTGDVIVENVNEGIDTVNASISYTAGANIENIVMLAQANKATGNDLNNVLDGSQTDYANSLVGGNGDDTYIVGVGDTTTEVSNAGTDTVIATSSWTLSTNVENLVLVGPAALNGTGSSSNNLITGNALDNVLDGKTGADTLIGGTGNDSYFIDNAGDVIVENGGEGTDYASSTVTYVLATNVENLTLAGTSSISGTGNALDNVIIGNTGNNPLSGGDGNDILDGGAGVDNLYGNAGADTFMFGLATALTASDSVKDFNAGEGDKIDISSLTTGYHALTDALTSYVKITEASGNTLLSVDIDGTGTTYGFTQIATITGLTGQSAASLVANGTLIVNKTNHGPTAQADTFSGSEDTVITGNVLANNGSGADSDPDGDPLVVAAGTFTTAHNGTVVLASDGSFTYTPAANYYGADSFTYTALDIQAVASQAAVTFNLASVNDNPVGKDDQFVTPAGQSVAGNVLADNGAGADSDVESSTLSVTAATLTTAHGSSVTLAADGTFNFTPAVGYFGSDSFTYTVNDGQGGTGSATVYIIVNATGGAVDDAFTANWGQTISGNVLADNGHGPDLNPDGDTLTVTPLSATTANGFTFSLASDGSLTYAAPAWFVGSDSFQYSLSDGHGGLTQATVSLTVAAPAGAVAGTLGSEAVTGTDASEYIFGDGGADTMSGLGGDDILIGGPGAQSIAGGTGNDTYYVDNASDLVIEAAGEGNDIVLASVSYILADNVGTLTLTGTAAIDGNGNGSNNRLTGNTGNNVLSAGAGNDSYYFVSGHGVDMVTETSGTDAIVFDASITAASITYFRSGADLLITHGVPGDRIIVTGFFSATANQIETVAFSDGTTHNVAYINAAVHIIAGTSGSDTLVASDDVSTSLSGLGGDDSLTGLGGNDSLTGGTGNDSVTGGGGNDTYYVSAGDGQDTVIDASGTDTLLFDASVSVASVTYSQSGSDLVISDGIVGDKVTISNFFTSPSNQVESVRFADGTVHDTTYMIRQAHTFIGTAAMDTLTGASDPSSPNDYLYGMANNDILNGGAGDDILDGGQGSDTMSGGTGNDTYYFDNTADVINENTNEGTDTVFITISYTLGANIENVVTIGAAAKATGNDLANVLDASQGGDFINSLAGGLGDDTYIISASDTVSESASAGIDTIIAAFSYTLGSNLENLILLGTDPLTGTGNAFNNVITATSGDNVLDGKTGADTTIGGAGNDTYFVDNTADVIVENPGEGFDIVMAATTYTLSANIETLVLSGTGSINGTGNAQDNIITGNASNNALTGGAGNDTIDGGAGSDNMAGGTGDDSYYVDKSSDVVTENAGEGTDTVFASYSYTMTANIEKMVLTGTTALNGTGSATDDTIIGNTAANILAGNAGNDTLDGSGGSDTLRGGAGNDLYHYTSGLVIIDEQSLGGSDTLFIHGVGINDITTALSGASLIITVHAGTDQITINNQASSTLATHVETVTFDDGFTTTLEDFQAWQRAGAGGSSFTGGAAHDTLLGAAGNDALNGLGGDDALHGGAGNDTVYGGTGNDLVFGGAGNDVLYGQGGIDTLVGGAGADTFFLQAANAFDAIDLFKDFSIAQGDQINIHELLAAYNPGVSTLSDFVHIVNDGAGNSLLQIDADGTANGAAFQTVASLTGLTNLDLNTLVSGGNLFL